MSGCCLSRRFDTNKLLPLHRGAVYSAGAAASKQGFYKYGAQTGAMFVSTHLLLCCSPRIDPGISYDYEYDYDIVDRAPGYDVYKQSHRGGGRMSSQNNVFSCTQTFQFKAHMKGHPPPPRWRRPGRSGTARRRWRRSSRRCTGTAAASPTARSAGAV